MQQFTVRVPMPTNKKYHVMRFSASNNVDVTKWKNVRLDRESALRDARLEEEIPKFGAGSEFGREARDEARRRKYSKYAKKPEDQPWILNVKSALKQPSNSAVPSSGKGSSRKFKGLREGGVTDHTSYYVFFQAHDGAFEAFPVSEWYNFTPIPRYKALTAEEAEEQFEKRDKILNFFTVMDSKKKAELAAADSLFPDEFGKIKQNKDFKVSDMDDWDELGGGSGGSDINSDGEGGGKDRKGKSKASQNKKKNESDDDDSEPLEESDEGDFDTREVDYMSDSSSDESDTEADRLAGVEDEDALRKLMLSEGEDEEENSENKEGERNATNVAGDEEDGRVGDSEGKMKIKEKNSESDESEDSDFDDNKYQSAMFMPGSKAANAAAGSSSGSGSGQSESRTTVDVVKQAALKRKYPDESSPGISGKRPRTVIDSIITEEAVKRYLQRKPITATELVQKFRSKIQITRDNKELNDYMINHISQILKKLNPEKTTKNGKMWLYIKP